MNELKLEGVKNQKESGASTVYMIHWNWNCVLFHTFAEMHTWVVSYHVAGSSSPHVSCFMIGCSLFLVYGAKMWQMNSFFLAYSSQWNDEESVFFIISLTTVVAVRVQTWQISTTPTHGKLSGACYHSLHVCALTSERDMTEKLHKKFSWLSEQFSWRLELTTTIKCCF